MVRIDTLGIIALMQDAYSMITVIIRDSAVMNYPGEAMGHNLADTNIKRTVTLSIMSTLPFPAFINGSDADKFPKTLNGLCPKFIFVHFGDFFLWNRNARPRTLVAEVAKPRSSVLNGQEYSLFDYGFDCNLLRDLARLIIAQLR